MSYKIQTIVFPFKKVYLFRFSSRLFLCIGEVAWVVQPRDLGVAGDGQQLGVAFAYKQIQLFSEVLRIQILRIHMFLGLPAPAPDPWVSKYQDPDPHPHLDPNPNLFVRGMDLRIRIHTKISWIRNLDQSSWIRIQSYLKRTICSKRPFLNFKFPRIRYLSLC
jgi:hypothetical protein